MASLGAPLAESDPGQSQHWFYKAAEVVTLVPLVRATWDTCSCVRGFLDDPGGRAG